MLLGFGMKHLKAATSWPSWLRITPPNPHKSPLSRKLASTYTRRWLTGGSCQCTCDGIPDGKLVMDPILWACRYFSKKLDTFVYGPLMSLCLDNVTPQFSLYLYDSLATRRSRACHDFCIVLIISILHCFSRSLHYWEIKKGIKVWVFGVMT